MNTSFKEIRDPVTHRLSGICCREKGFFKSKQKGREMVIQFPPGTPIKFSFGNSKPTA